MENGLRQRIFIGTSKTKASTGSLIDKKHNAPNYVYFETYLESIYGHYSDKQYIRKGLYQSYIHRPALYGTMMLFASFGLLDIAYTMPEPKGKNLKEAEYISPYEGLSHIRLTDLGAYIVGLTPTYQEPQVQKEKVLLDENNLLISYKGDNKSLLSILTQISQPAGSYLYKSKL